MIIEELMSLALPALVGIDMKGIHRLVDGFSYDLIFFLQKLANFLGLILYIFPPPMKIPIYATAYLKITLLNHGTFMFTYKFKVSNDII